MPGLLALKILPQNWFEPGQKRPPNTGDEKNSGRFKKEHSKKGRVVLGNPDTQALGELWGEGGGSQSEKVKAYLDYHLGIES